MRKQIDTNDYQKLDEINAQKRIDKENKQKKFIQEYYIKKNIGDCCKVVGISRCNYYVWMKDDWFREAVENINEGIIDGLEMRVITIANQDEKLDTALKATTAFLNAKAKNRGWGKELDSNVNINLVADLRSKVLQAGDNYIDINAEVQKDADQQPVSELLDSNVSNDRLSIDDEMQDLFK